MHFIEERQREGIEPPKARGIFTGGKRRLAVKRCTLLATAGPTARVVGGVLTNAGIPRDQGLHKG